MVQNGVKEDHKEPPSDGRARQQSGREGGGGDDGEVEQEPSQSAPDWDSIPATEPPKHKTSGDHLEYMAGNLVDSLVNEPEEVRNRIKYAASQMFNISGARFYCSNNYCAGGTKAFSHAANSIRGRRKHHRQTT